MTPPDYQGFTEGVLDRRPPRLDLARADRPGRPADPDAEVPARAVRPPVRRRRARPTRRSAPDKDLARRASQESLVLLRNQNNVAAAVDRASARSSSPGRAPTTSANQLGGWSVSWQGVFGSNQPCCVGPADQIPPAITVLKGIQAGRRVRPPRSSPHPTRPRRSARSADADAAVVVVGEKAYAEVLGDRPLPRLDADQQALIRALRGDGQARHRRRAGRAPARPRARASRRTRC